MLYRKYQYGYDAANRITGIGIAGQAGQSFGYDNLDRLAGYADAGHTTTYAYDANRKLTTPPATSSPTARMCYV
jgi:uncharacterized protein RhaS with RHS repeats